MIVSLKIATLCAIATVSWSAYTAPRKGDLRAQCVKEKYDDTVHTMQLSGTSKTVAYRFPNFTCQEWQREILVEDEHGKHKWTSIMQKQL